MNAGASLVLLSEATEGRIARPVGERLYEATAGNPLALTEICAHLSDDQLTGVQPLDEPLHAGPSLQRALRRRSTDAPARRPSVLCWSQRRATRRPCIRSRPRSESLHLGVEALEAAETADLIKIEGAKLEFRHPLFRSAVYHGATAPERRAAHAALAKVLTGERDAGGGPGTWPTRHWRRTRTSRRRWRTPPWTLASAAAPRQPPSRSNGRRASRRPTSSGAVVSSRQPSPMTWPVSSIGRSPFSTRLWRIPPTRSCEPTSTTFEVVSRAGGARRGRHSDSSSRRRSASRLPIQRGRRCCS